MLTDSTTDEAAVVPELVERVEEEIERFTGDGAYDQRAIYAAFIPRGATVVVPPSRRTIESGGDTPADQARDPAGRTVEVRLACNILNRLLELGAARSCSI